MYHEDKLSKGQILIKVTSAATGAQIADRWN